MATGPKDGFQPSRKLGSAPNNLGITEYTIADGYATSIFKGDVVKVNATGTIELAAAGDRVVGVFLGCAYAQADGTPTEARYWPASTSSATTVTAKVSDDPNQTYNVVGNAALTTVYPGDLYDTVIGTGSTITGNSAAQMDVTGGTVLIGLSTVKVVRVIDTATNEVEVILSVHDFKDND